MQPTAPALLIYMAAEGTPLNIDTEDMAFDSEITVQNVSAKLYSKANDNQNAIAFVKNDTSILIRGNVALDELIKISENLIF